MEYAVWVVVIYFALRSTFSFASLVRWEKDKERDQLALRRSSAAAYESAAVATMMLHLALASVNDFYDSPLFPYLAVIMLVAALHSRLRAFLYEKRHRRGVRGAHVR